VGGWVCGGGACPQELLLNAVLRRFSCIHAVPPLLPAVCFAACVPYMPACLARHAVMPSALLHAAAAMVWCAGTD
jgi:hypothetical protein